MLYKPKEYKTWRELDPKIDKPNTLVVVSFPKTYATYVAGYPFQEGDVVLFLGEIENMPSHAVIAMKNTPHIAWGYHFELFRVIPEEDA